MKPTYRISLMLVLLSILSLSGCGKKHEAHLRGGAYLLIDDETYVLMSNCLFDESYKKICKTSNGYTVYEVVGDKEHNYVVARVVWSAKLFVKESYIPDRTVVSEVNIGGDKKDILMMK